jgi:hypothetical protein
VDSKPVDSKPVSDSSWLVGGVEVFDLSALCSPFKLRDESNGLCPKVL